MKNGKFFLLISIFLFIYCDNRNRITPIIDIDVLQISYELAYEENYALKVIIQTINDLDVSVNFPAKLKAFKSKEEFNLNFIYYEKWNNSFININFYMHILPK